MLYDYIVNNYDKDEPIFLSELPGNSKDYIRQEMKQLLRDLARRYPRLQENMLAALRNDAQYGLWQKTPGAGMPKPPPED